VQFVGLGKYVSILLKTFITHAATATTCAYQNTRAASPTFHSAFNPPVSIQTASHVPKTTTSLSYRYNTNLISPASHRTPYIVSLSYHIAAVSIIHPSTSSQPTTTSASTFAGPQCTGSMCDEVVVFQPWTPHAKHWIAARKNTCRGGGWCRDADMDDGDSCFERWCATDDRRHLRVCLGKCWYVKMRTG
jgi:hypothetical protein